MPGATDASVEDFLAAVEPERRRDDARVVDALLREVTGEAPRLWGPSIVGYGNHPYEDAKGKLVDWPLVAFSPRKAQLVLYVLGGLDADELLARLGRHSTGKGCLYVKSLADVDLDVLRELVERYVAAKRAR